MASGHILEAAFENFIDSSPNKSTITLTTLLTLFGEDPSAFVQEYTNSTLDITDLQGGEARTAALNALKRTKTRRDASTQNPNGNPYSL